ncbi:hypothetical protein [Kitasatospora sp. NPDC001547]|uniref:hypothetical protein n=1 Tax=Kitasatospora sp. NPDC001547 TaxID=3364015 RepID=UPI0036956AFA
MALRSARGWSPAPPRSAITDEDLRELLNLPAIADLRSQRSNEDLLRLALQIAVLRAVADLDLHRVITFHSRVTAAREFAGTVLETAQLLEDKDRRSGSGRRPWRAPTASRTAARRSRS